MALLRSQHGLISYLAERLGLSRQALHQWERVPAERLPEVEQITGFPRWLMRPDIVPPPLWWIPPALPPPPAFDFGEGQAVGGTVEPAPRRRRRTAVAAVSGCEPAA